MTLHKLLQRRRDTRRVPVCSGISRRLGYFAFGVSCLSGLGSALLTAAPASPSAVAPSAPSSAKEEEAVVLSPFTVEVAQDTGYLATSSLAGTRLRTELSDIGTAVSVLTKEFLDDIAATDAQSALAYATNMEITGPRGNYLGAGSSFIGNADETAQFFAPASDTRVRGLVSADNTRNYFRTNVAWDSYNVSRIDMLRGPNSILFGLGSPGGVVNGSVDSASLQKSAGVAHVATDQWGSLRSTLNFNRVIARNELAVRMAVLRDNKKFRQDYAFDNDRRVYVAAKYRPRFLNRARSSNFEITADVERGWGQSNRPRNAPPIDQVTPFVSPLTIRDIQLPAGSNYKGYVNGIVPGGQFYLAGYTVPTYIANFSATPVGTASNGVGPGARLIVSGGPESDYWQLGQLFSYGVLTANGSVYRGSPTATRNLWGVAYREKIITPLNSYAIALGHPFGSAFTATSLTDPTTFDFYNTLIDGPNKSEWSDFTQQRAAVSHTFFDNRIGYELSYGAERSNRAQYSMLNANNRILIDLNQFNVDGTPNPNVGRAFVQEDSRGGSRLVESELEAVRVSTFLTHDFRKTGRGPDLLRRLLGRHVLNGVWSEENDTTDSRSYQHFSYDDELLAIVGQPNRFQNAVRPTLRYYVSGDLRGLTTLAGTNFSAMTRDVVPLMGGPTAISYFDTTWKATGVSPAAAWTNPQGQRWEQAANPANYVGWRTATFNIIDALGGQPGEAERSTWNAVFRDNRVRSAVFTWQGYLLNNQIVVTYGQRRDQSRSLRVDAPLRPDNGANLDPGVYTLGNGVRDAVTVESRSRSVVGHLDRLPVFRSLPVRVSLSYNEGENFNPTAGRVDILNQVLPAPSGQTREFGVLLTTRDNRYQLRVQRYETAITNDSGPPLANVFRLQQFLGENGAVAAYEASSGILRQLYEQQATLPQWKIDDQEKLSAPAWYAFERELKARFPGFVDAWLNGGSFAPSSDKTRFLISGIPTADTESRGYEIEFTANPMPRLRLTLNASQTEAQQDNVPGRGMADLFNFIQEALFQGTTPTAMGQLRTAYSPLSTNMADWWVENVLGNFNVLQQLNGQLNPELVKWRANAVGNYRFDAGRLKGFSIGGAYRWESGAAVGYPRYFDEFGFVIPDIAHPIERPSSDRIDLTVGYRRKLRHFDWSVQLNVLNILGQNELLPVKANPDGTYSLFRIQEGSSWRLTNSFKF